MGKKIPVVLAKVHGRASKRDGFDGFFRAGVKWTDDPKGTDREFVIVDAATEKGLTNDERKSLGVLLSAGKVVRELHFRGVLTDPMVMAVVKAFKQSELELPEPEPKAAPEGKTLLEILAEIVAEDTTPKPAPKR